MGFKFEINDSVEVMLVWDIVVIGVLLMVYCNCICYFIVLVLFSGMLVSGFY